MCVLLGPGLNIKRSPFLAGKMAGGYIRGIQKNGMSACPKHFAAKFQELRGWLPIPSWMNGR